jgi:hypothetical protein
MCVSLSLSIYLWLYSSLSGLGQFFSLLTFYTVGRTPPRTGDQSFARALPRHRTTQTQNKCTQTYMPQLGFEPTIPVFQRTKTVHTLDLAATVIGYIMHLLTVKVLSLCLNIIIPSQFSNYPNI